MQTILGASGIIGIELAKALTAYTSTVRLVSRNPKEVSGKEELFAADLTDSTQAEQAVAGSEIVYLTPGLRYNAKIWQQQWPVLMQNVIRACIKNKSKLVFFDNVYAYGKVSGPMTEQTPYNAVSIKGLVRRQIAEMIMHEVEKGSLEAIIARSADFYGPNTTNSFLNLMVIAKHAAGKSAQWMVNADVPHSFTYTPDAGFATAVLGNTPHAYNQVWHLPTATPALTGREWVNLSAAAFGVKPAIQVLPKWMLRMLGLFIEPIRESMELIYQNDSPYLFDSSKIDKELGLSATTYQAGLSATANSLR